MDGIDLIRCTLQPRMASANAPHQHPWHEFHLVVQGSGRFAAAGDGLRLSTGTAWYTRPRRPHQIAHIDHGPLLQYVAWVRLDRRLARTTQRDWPEMTPRQTGSGDELLFWRMQEELRRDTPHARSAATHRFAAWLHTQLDRHDTTAAREPAPLCAMRQHLDAQLHRQVTLAEIARCGGVSPAYAVRLFRRHLGRPPLAWHRHRRLEAAARWLAGSDLPIQDVAHHTGFADPLYFSRAFRVWSGLSPLAWRRQRAPQQAPQLA
jgi:AraC-like DNA-binding protein/mannose-6-phosphate isomerase-like protein (cupin superfamily)